MLQHEYQEIFNSIFDKISLKYQELKNVNIIYNHSSNNGFNISKRNNIGRPNDYILSINEDNLIVALKTFSKSLSFAIYDLCIQNIYFDNISENQQNEISLIEEEINSLISYDFYSSLL